MRKVRLLVEGKYDDGLFKAIALEADPHSRRKGAT
jgi:hypothetical protein